MVCKAESRNEERAGASRKAAEDADENEISSPLFSWKLDLFFLYNCQPDSCLSSPSNHHKLCVLALGLAWPRSNRLSLGPYVAVLCRHGLCGMRAEQSSWDQQGRDMGWRPQDRHQPPVPPPQGRPLSPQNCPAHPVAKAAFSFKTTRGGSGAKARAARSPGDLSLRKYFLQRGPPAAAGTMGDSQREQS